MGCSTPCALMESASSSSASISHFVQLRVWCGLTSTRSIGTSRTSCPSGLCRAAACAWRSGIVSGTAAPSPGTCAPEAAGEEEEEEEEETPAPDAPITGALTADTDAAADGCPKASVFWT